MMIGLIDVDSHHYPNLALMKLSAWHKKQGDSVEWWDESHSYDIVYMSKVFTELYTPDLPEPTNTKKVIKGGTGYGLGNKLPYEIEHIQPDRTIYFEKLPESIDTAYGFLTRGCPRNCGFCIVGEKEGLRSQKVADLSEWWSGEKNIQLMDPNILACRDRIDLLTQLCESRAYVDFNQGLDIRLTTPEIAEILGKTRVKSLHFAWDNPKQDLTEHFRNFTEWYRRKNHRTKIVYCLTNYGSTLEEDLYRVYTLRELGYDPYIMVYDKPNAPKVTKKLQRWCNNKWVFGKVKRFEDYQP